LKTWARASGCADFNYPFLTLKERDNETGLDYFLARYYSSPQGRFTSPDEFTGGPDELYTFVDEASDNPTFYADLTNPQSLNKYQYSYNNPLRYVDLDGHDPDNTEPEVQEPKCPCQPPTPAQINQTVDSISKALDAWAAQVRGEIVNKVAIPTAIAVTMVESLIRGPVATTDTPPSQQSEPLPPPAPIQSKPQTEEKKKNLADADRKGIPRDQLGPSGIPKTKVVKHPTEKRAKDAARNQGQGAPAKDVSPTKGRQHYHPTNREGSRKKGKQNVHHEYPD
jgi:RHS repeat-associated protein